MSSRSKRGLNVVIISLLLLGCFLAYANRGKSEESVNPKQKVVKKTKVILRPLAKQTFERSVVVQGNLEAKNFANVSARMDGTIEKIYVEEGDVVIAGNTKLFQSDAVKSQKAVDISKQDLAVARCSLREAQANLEQVVVSLEKAETDVKRYEKLFKQKTISADRYENAQTLYKQTKAQKKHAESIIDLRKEQLAQAELSVKMAEKDLSDTLVYAPIDGIVSCKYQETGESGAVGKHVIRIDDVSVIEVSAFLPAKYYSRIKAGKTVLSLTAEGFEIKDQLIVYKSPTIDPKLRTFEVKSLLKNVSDDVAPGALADINIVLERKEGFGVPADAVQQRSGKEVVFKVENNIAKMVEVSVGLATNGDVEIMGRGLNEGDNIVTLGQYLLNDGMEVSVQGEGV